MALRGAAPGRRSAPHGGPRPEEGRPTPALLEAGWRLCRTRRGGRIEQHGVLLSELAGRPGPTHTLFDVLAAALAAFAPGPRLLVLGFAGGSVVAPLRALGAASPLTAVDLSTAGEPLFRELSARWCGRVRVVQAEAGAFLARAQRPFDGVLEDLSIPVGGDLVKPSASYGALPAAIARRLRPGGVAVLNLLPTPGWPWARALEAARRPFAHALELRLADYVNRIVLASDAPLSPRREGARLRAALRRLRSRQAGRLAVRGLPAARSEGRA